MLPLKFRILFFTVLFLSSFGTYAQHIIQGKVSNSKTGNPIENAQIIVEGTQQVSTTNKKGLYQLKVKKSKEKTLSLVSFVMGMKSKIQTVTLDKKNIRLDFLLDEFTAELEGVEIHAKQDETFGIRRLASVEGFGIYDAKKNEVLVLKDIDANLATNSARQIFSKVAGLNVWESDGFGLQLEIGARGLSPKRSADFNIRQNGYDISADPIGYPESYYTPPSEALQQIQIIRGAASLQYGPQFGGMVNFVIKDAPKDKKIELVSRQSLGSYGLFNSFNSLGGTIGKFSYYTYFQYKQADGWRPNSNFEQYNYFGKLNYQLHEKLNIGIEYTRMKYEARQPGGLTDKQFKENPLVSNRNRNWFDVDWNLFSINLDYTINDRLRLNSRSFGLVASRKALGLLSKIDRLDDPKKNRDLFWDDYRNIGNETRLIYTYYLSNTASTLLVGGRYFRGNLHRMQGYGDKTTDPNFHFVKNETENIRADTLESDYRFPNTNYALFVENIFAINEKITITPGIRYERIQTKSEGYYLRQEFVGKKFEKEQLDKPYEFTILGLGIGYKPTENIELYTNVSQNFKGVNYNDIRVTNPNIEIDSNIKEESGYNADLGFRGLLFNKINFDASGFILYHEDKIGIMIIEDSLKRKRKNIGSSLNIGIETFVETDIMSWIKPNSASKMNVYSNLTWLEAKYLKSENKTISGNRVELVPQLLLRAGLSYEYKNFRTSLKYAYTSDQFTDAQNSTEIDDSAVSGLVPAYDVLDLSFKYRYKLFQIETGVNNLLDKSYFTRRADGYPGPGILPASPRAYYLTLQLKL